MAKVRTIYKASLGDFELYLDRHEFLVVSFIDPECEHCMQMQPQFEKLCFEIKRLRKNMNYNVSCLEVNVRSQNQNVDLSGPQKNPLNLKELPTVAMYELGEPRQIFSGSHQSEPMYRWVYSLIWKRPPSKLNGCDQINSFIKNNSVSAILLFLEKPDFEMEWNTEEQEVLRNFTEAGRSRLNQRNVNLAYSNAIDLEDCLFTQSVVRLDEDFNIIQDQHHQAQDQQESESVPFASKESSLLQQIGLKGNWQENQAPPFLHSLYRIVLFSYQPSQLNFTVKLFAKRTFTKDNIEYFLATERQESLFLFDEDIVYPMLHHNQSVMVLFASSAEVERARVLQAVKVIQTQMKHTKSLLKYSLALIDFNDTSKAKNTEASLKRTQLKRWANWVEYNNGSEIRLVILSYPTQQQVQRFVMFSAITAEDLTVGKCLDFFFKWSVNKYPPYIRSQPVVPFDADENSLELVGDNYYDTIFNPQYDVLVIFCPIRFSVKCQPVWEAFDSLASRLYHISDLYFVKFDPELNDFIEGEQIIYFPTVRFYASDNKDEHFSLPLQEGIITEDRLYEFVKNHITVIKNMTPEHGHRIPKEIKGATSCKIGCEALELNIKDSIDGNGIFSQHSELLQENKLIGEKHEL